MADYTIPRTDPGNTPINVSDDQIGITIPPIDIPLVGQNSTNYGTAVATTQVHLLENFSNSTAPGFPLQGQLWFDSTTSTLQVNVGGDGGLAIWEPVATGSGGEINDGTNVPPGTIPNSASVFAGKTGVTLQFKTIVGGNNIAVTPDAAGEFLTVSYTGSVNVGETNTASSVGTGNSVYKEKIGVDLRFRTITAGSGIQVSTSGDNIQIDNTGGGAGVGEVNTASNLGFQGEGLFWQKSGVDLQFRRLVAGANITLSGTSTDITIDSTGGGGGGGLNAVVEDLTPQLGGTLDDNKKGIIIKDQQASTESNPTLISSGQFGIPIFRIGPQNGAAGYSRDFFFTTKINANNSSANRSVVFTAGGNIRVQQEPTSNDHLTTKLYVDTAIANAGSSYTSTQLANRATTPNATFSLSANFHNFDQIHIEFIDGSKYTVAVHNTSMIRTNATYVHTFQPTGADRGSVEYKFTGNTTMSQSNNQNVGGIKRVFGIKH